MGDIQDELSLEEKARLEGWVAGERFRELGILFRTVSGNYKRETAGMEQLELLEYSRTHLGFLERTKNQLKELLFYGQTVEELYKKVETERISANLTIMGLEQKLR